jgi:uncharacterized iron-regulated protein
MPALCRWRCARALLAAAAALLVPVGVSTTHAGELTFATAAGERLTLAELVPRLRSARFVLFGEVHGDYRHHDVQVRTLAALRDAGVPVAVGLEAFPAAATPQLARWTSGTLDSAELYQLFEADWSLENWPAYRGLLFYLRDRRVPSAGVNADEALIVRVARGGLAALSAAERAALPAEGCAADERYRALLAAELGAQAADGGVFGTFCEAQSLRDAVLAAELTRLAAAQPDHLVVGLVGLFHAWKPAVPARLARRPGGRVAVILPEEALLQPIEGLAREADYFWRWRD